MSSVLTFTAMGQPRGQLGPSIFCPIRTSFVQQGATLDTYVHRPTQEASWFPDSITQDNPQAQAALDIQEQDIQLIPPTPSPNKKGNQHILFCTSSSQVNLFFRADILVCQCTVIRVFSVLECTVIRVLSAGHPCGTLPRLYRSRPVKGQPGEQ